MKLMDLVLESMADGNAFKAFVNAAVTKKETQTNEGLNLEKVYKIFSPSTGYLTSVKLMELDKMLQDDVVFNVSNVWYSNLSIDEINNKYKTIK